MVATVRPASDSTATRGLHPFSLRERVVRASRRTEGRLILLLAVLVLLGIVAGVVGVVGVRHQVALLSSVASDSSARNAAASGTTQSSAGAALDGYVSLANADATAAAAFLPGVAGPAELTRYRQHVAKATAALTVAATAASTDVSAAAVAALSNYLPVFNGQVEDARLASLRRELTPDIANQLAANKLRQPAVTARENMLPAARKLYLDQAERLAATQDGATSVPWVGFALVILLVGGLVFAQVYLAKQTRRRFNLGLLLATVAALGAVVWLVAATSSAAAGGAASRRDGSAQIEALAEVRVAGLKARSDEAMTLIAIGNGPQYFDSRFEKTVAKMTGADGLLARARATAGQLGTREVLDIAAERLHSWLELHRSLHEMDRDGRHDEAVATAASAAQTIDEFDIQLALAMTQATERQTANAAAARSALSIADVGIGLLLAGVVVGTLAGMWRRIAEYR